MRKSIFDGQTLRHQIMTVIAAIAWAIVVYIAFFSATLFYAIIALTLTLLLSVLLWAMIGWIPLFLKLNPADINKVSAFNLKMILTDAKHDGLWTHFQTLSSLQGFVWDYLKELRCAQSDGEIEALEKKYFCTSDEDDD